ncbi:MAG TPA: MazG family protein [Micromonosporaceae bacterium]|nr:MazG family protein [Micromonosporaceae bacterium]
MTGRAVLLVTTPRLPAGLLTAQAWELVRAHPVYAAAEDDQVSALRAAGADVTIVEARAQPLLDAVVEHGTVVWLAGPGGDEDLARELGHRLVRAPGVAALEVVVGSWDPPGARLLDAVTVMDRLLAPEGGDPWKLSQTHRSLAGYLLEEAYEAYDAIEADDLTALREELGDVLLQVVLHARMAADAADEDRFDVDDVAGGLVDKLIRRNPHVFAGEPVGGIDDIVANWEQIKKAEKARDSVLDGIALAQPALSLAAKVLERMQRAGLDGQTAAGPESGAAADAESGAAADAEPGAGGEAALGAALLAIVADARSRGLDAEAALRRTVLDLAARARRAERAAG